MKTEVVVEDSKFLEAVSWLPSVVVIAIALPMDEKVHAVVASFVVHDPLWDERFFGVELDERSGVLSLVWVTRRVGLKKGDVKDGVDLESGWKIEDEGDGREFPNDLERTEVSSVEFEGGSSGGDVSRAEPDEISFLKEVDLVAFFVELRWRTSFPIEVLLLEFLSLEDGVVDVGVESG